MATSTTPSIGTWKQGFKDLFFDTARNRLIDVETVQDDNNIPDRVDIKTGNARTADPTGGNFISNNSRALMVGGFVLGALGLGYLFSRRRRG